MNCFGIKVTNCVDTSIADNSNELYWYKGLEQHDKKVKSYEQY